MLEAAVYWLCAIWWELDRALMPPAENPHGTCSRENIYYTWGLEVLITLGNSDNILHT